MSVERAKYQPLFAVAGGLAEPADDEPLPEPEGPLFVTPQVCPICHGAGWETARGKGARPCKCLLKKKRGNLLEQARIPLRFTECSLQNFYPTKGQYYSSQGSAFNYASRMAFQFPNIDKGLLLMGSVGVGKTHLAVGIIRQIIERMGVPCLFYEFGALLKEIQNSYNPISHTSELQVLAPVCSATVLVLDELGAAKPTDWVLDTMMHIINTRYNEKKLTIFTTNYLDQRFNPREETLEERIGVRLRSRLYEMCKTIHIEGDDYRRRFDKIEVLRSAR